MKNALGARTPPVSPPDLRRVVETNARRELALETRGAAYRAVLDRALEEVAAGPRALALALPAAIGAALEARGWLWNGFYVLGEDGKLHLGPAHGPPVCSPLERASEDTGALTSGMCFDGLLLNQALVSYAAKDWPGYVSCDATSGLATVSGIVTPVRDADGRPIAVWDLDATEPVLPEDVRFFDVLFASLARAVSFTPEAFAPPSAPAT